MLLDSLVTSPKVNGEYAAVSVLYALGKLADPPALCLPVPAVSANRDPFVV